MTYFQTENFRLKYVLHPLSNQILKQQIWKTVLTLEKLALGLGVIEIIFQTASWHNYPSLLHLD